MRTETLKTEETNLSIALVSRYMREQLNIYLPVYLALSLSTLVGYAYFSWVPTLFVRIFGWSIPEIGYAFGLIVLIAAPCGVILCGWLIDKLYREGILDALTQ